MSATEAGGTNGGPSLLSREEGTNDIWWPYVPAPEVGRHTNKVLGEQTEGRLFQALVAYPRGAAPPLHIHHDADETFFVLDCEVTIFSPAGIDGFFAEVAPAVIAGARPPAPSMPDQDEFIRLMAKYECEFVGRPPTLDD
jgi:hypothetical protein